MNAATSADLFFPPKSGVLIPLSSAVLTAVLSELAALPHTQDGRVESTPVEAVREPNELCLGAASIQAADHEGDANRLRMRVQDVSS